MASKTQEKSQKKKLKIVGAPLTDDEKNLSRQASEAVRKFKLFLLLLPALILVAVVSYSWKVKESSKTKEGEAAHSLARNEGGAMTPNAPPQIVSVKLSPSSPLKGDSIKAEAATQGREGYPVSLSYQWSVNGTPQSETSEVFTGDFNKGDKISLTVIPFDEKGKGEPFSVSTYAFNSPPRIASTIQDSSSTNGDFSYQVKATDPDNDTLKYSLKSAPAGMTIDLQTGLIKWSIPSGYSGKVFVYVAVSDGSGGEATQIFNFQLDQ